MEDEYAKVLIEKIRSIKRIDILQYIDIIVSDILEEQESENVSFSKT